MKNQKYHTVRTVPKNITLSEQFQKYHTVRTVPKNITLPEQFQKIIETETNLLLIVITICTEIIYLANSTRF